MLLKGREERQGHPKDAQPGTQRASDFFYFIKFCCIHPEGMQVICRYLLYKTEHGTETGYYEYELPKGWKDWLDEKPLDYRIISRSAELPFLRIAGTMDWTYELISGTFNGIQPEEKDWRKNWLEIRKTWCKKNCGRECHRLDYCD